MITVETAQPPARPARRDLVVTWALCVAGLAAAKVVSLFDPTGLLAGNLAGVAAFLFIALPERQIHAQGERWSDYGVPWWGLRERRTWQAWGRGLRTALLVCSVLFPLFFAVFWAYSQAVPHLPPRLASIVAPYSLPHSLRLRLPPRLLLFVLVQVLVIALPEEMFYRGWMQTSWAASDPRRRVRVLGATLGVGFLATQALFAAGHLVVLQPWRLATFLPGLLFGWLRERTGDVSAPVLVHALSNVFLATLEASFYG